MPPPYGGQGEEAREERGEDGRVHGKSGHCPGVALLQTGHSDRTVAETG